VCAKRWSRNRGTVSRAIMRVPDHPKGSRVVARAGNPDSAPVKRLQETSIPGMRAREFVMPNPS
jgi:hypothetical protein